MVNSDDITKLGFRWYFVNDKWYPIDIDSQIIVNTDVRGNPGVHWIMIAKLHDGTIYCYDPLGKSNKRVDSQLQSVEHYLQDIDYFFPYKSQLNNSVHCGYFSLYVANLFRAAHQGCPNDANEANRIIEREFGRSADMGDEKRLGRADTTKMIW